MESAVIYLRFCRLNAVPFWRSSTISWMISSSTGVTWSSCLGERRREISTVLSCVDKRSGHLVLLLFFQIHVYFFLHQTPILVVWLVSKCKLACCLQASTKKKRATKPCIVFVLLKSQLDILHLLGSKNKAVSGGTKCNMCNKKQWSSHIFCTMCWKDGGDGGFVRKQRGLEEVFLPEEAAGLSPLQTDRPLTEAPCPSGLLVPVYHTCNSCTKRHS